MKTPLIAVTLLLVALLTPMSGASFDLKPFAGDDAPLVSPLIEGRIQQWRAMLGQAYKERGVRNPKWDAAVESLLEDIALDLGGGSPSRSGKEILEEASRLRGKEVGCKDVILRWVLFTYAKKTGIHWKRQNKACDKWTGEWGKDTKRRKDAGPRYTALLLLEANEHMIGTWHKDKRFLEKAPEFAGYFSSNIKGGLQQVDWSHSPEVLLEAIDNVRLYNHAIAEAVLAEVGPAVDASSLPLWAQHLAKSIMHTNTGFAWRGSGWASTVTEDGWKGFRKHLSLADEYLEKAWAADNSQIAIANQGVSLSGPSNTSAGMEEWFNRCLTVCFDDRRPYNTRLYYLLPRWGGSHEEIIEFGMACAETGRFDTEIPWQMIRAMERVAWDVKSLKRDRGVLKQVYGKPGVLEALEAVFNGYLKQRGEEKSSRYTCALAVFYYCAGNAEKAAELLAEVPVAERSSWNPAEYGVSYDDIIKPTAKASNNDGKAKEAASEGDGF